MGMCSIVKTHTSGWATHKQEVNYNCRGSPKGAMGLSPTLAPHPGGPAPEDEPLEQLALKDSGAYFWET